MSSLPKNKLLSLLYTIDKKGYKNYKSLKGIYNWNTYQLSIDYIQPDPFAPPSRVRLIMDLKQTGFPQNLYKNKTREIAFRDFLTRKIYEFLKKGKHLSIQKPSNAVLDRNSIIINKDLIELRLFVKLPAIGRKILATESKKIFFEKIPYIVEKFLNYRNFQFKTEVKQFIETIEDAEFIRANLKKRGLVAFIANGSILPRKSGVEESPLLNAMKFKSPPSLEIEFNLPNKGKIKGMGIPEGITLITGGGFHGKSTLLDAISYGIYNHIPGDGREFVITLKNAVKIKSENGRYVSNVNISGFINNLPTHIDTEKFSTENASGSTSMASSIMEAVEAGAELLLIDEDTSATNFLIRDEIIQKVILKEWEPITPFIDQAKNIYKKYGISTILVTGGAGDYFEIADKIILMKNYQPHDITEKTREIIKNFPVKRQKEKIPDLPDKDSLIRIPQKNIFIQKVSTKSKTNIKINKTLLDISALEQIVEINQTKTIGDSIKLLYNNIFDNKLTLIKTIKKLKEVIDREGYDILFSRQAPSGCYAEVRDIDIIMALNRFRLLKILQEP